MPPTRRVSEGQMEELVAWMESHPVLARTPQLASSHLLWKDLASRLNAVGDGVSKTSKEWRIYWSDQKFKVRRKVLQLQQRARSTVGGSALSCLLNPIEQRISSLVGVQQTADGITSPTEKPRPLVNLPRRALSLEERRLREEEKRRQLEERRVALEKLRLEEERSFRRSMLALEEQRSIDQRNFQQGLLSLVGHLLETLAPLPSPTSD